ncbi:hypothetical protein [Streptomyces fulvoviolaceus]|uniref:hypothetical protein n=1 Tax=Streptomyces fulvoviolaceus TaxID=285535 RepID=UPI0004C8B795|nr:hypothetical protein [Streptomyces fulvoviolaceus]MCT9084120.1 hypothetical protein [Streptomyces fulvoviolaceus]
MTGDAQAHLENLQRRAYQQLGMPVPHAAPPHKSELDYFLRYLATNTAYSEDRAREEAQKMFAREDDLPDRPDIARISSSQNILTARVDELKTACASLDPSWDLSNICFGVVPGGGLDAYTERVKDEFAIIIPEGLFSLANLFCRLVVLLQPIEPGGFYLPLAQFEQLRRAGEDPHVRFRTADVLRAYFLHGDPYAALPYRSALPYQDTFTYLMTGAELYVIAHEAAHVRLGHLDTDSPMTPEEELAADELAHRILVNSFSRHDDQSEARAALAGFLFHGLNEMWEKTVSAALGEAFDSRPAGEHPPAAERTVSFGRSLPDATPPPWFLFVFTAVDLATRHLPDSLLPGLLLEAERLGGINQRAAPRVLAHLCRASTAAKEHHWAETTARLIASEDRADVLLGAWFLVDGFPHIAIDLYKGLSDEDDPDFQALCRVALITLEPIYEHYFPRLAERFHEVYEQDKLDDYMVNMTRYATMQAIGILRERSDSAPWVAGFFDDQAEETHGTVEEGRG